MTVKTRILLMSLLVFVSLLFISIKDVIVVHASGGSTTSSSNTNSSAVISNQWFTFINNFVAGQNQQAQMLVDTKQQIDTDNLAKDAQNSLNTNWKGSSTNLGNGKETSNLSDPKIDMKKGDSYNSDVIVANVKDDSAKTLEGVEYAQGLLDSGHSIDYVNDKLKDNGYDFDLSLTTLTHDKNDNYGHLGKDFTSSGMAVLGVTQNGKYSGLEEVPVTWMAGNSQAKPTISTPTPVIPPPPVIQNKYTLTIKYYNQTAGDKEFEEEKIVEKNIVSGTVKNLQSYKKEIIVSKADGATYKVNNSRAWANIWNIDRKVSDLSKSYNIKSDITVHFYYTQEDVEYKKLTLEYRRKSSNELLAETKELVYAKDSTVNLDDVPTEINGFKYLKSYTIDGTYKEGKPSSVKLSNDTKIVFWYDKSEVKITVKYMIKDTQTEIARSNVYGCQPNIDSYVLPDASMIELIQVEDMIYKYDSSSCSPNQSALAGNFSLRPIKDYDIEVVRWYVEQPQDVRVTIRYLEENTERELWKIESEPIFTGNTYVLRGKKRNVYLNNLGGVISHGDTYYNTRVIVDGREYKFENYDNYPSEIIVNESKEIKIYYQKVMKVVIERLFFEVKDQNVFTGYLSAQFKEEYEMKAGGPDLLALYNLRSDGLPLEFNEENFPFYGSVKQVDQPTISFTKDNYTQFKNDTKQYLVKYDSNIGKVTIIFIYVKDMIDEVLDSTANIKAEEIILRSNDRGNEEYDVTVAIPTSEDLYANGLNTSLFYLKYSIKGFKTNTGEFNYKYRIPYYNSEGEVKYYDVERNESGIEYQYFNPQDAILYKIDKAVVESQILQNGSEDITINTDDGEYIVTLEYSQDAGIVPGESYAEDNVYKNVDSAEKRAIEILSDGTFEKSFNDAYSKMKVKMGVLRVKYTRSSTGEGTYIILNGEIMPLKDSLTYVPPVAKEFPVTDDNLLYRNKDLYVKKTAENKTYNTTGKIIYVAEKAYDKTGSEIPSSSIKNVEKAYDNGNNVLVHTPVVNYSSIIVGDNKLKNQSVYGKDNGAAEIDKEVILGEKFIIRIPNSGKHSDIKGYGNRDFDRSGVAHDLNNIENSKVHYAKEKGIVFDKVGVIYLNKYYEPGEYIELVKDNNTGQEEFEFIIPEWELEVWNGKYVVATTYVVAENASISNPSKYNNVSELQMNTKKENYIAYDKVKMTVIGRMDGFEITFTDDPNWELNEALDANKAPIGQYGQNVNKANSNALRLGYSAYFDLNILGYKGDHTETLNIIPKFYYISKNGGTSSEEVNLYNKTNYQKLDNVINIIVTSLNNNKIKHLSPINIIDEIRQAGSVYGTSKYNYATNYAIGTVREVSIGEGARLPNVITNNNLRMGVLNIKNRTNNEFGHYYGRFTLPNDTIVVDKSISNVNANTSIKKDGYILVAFDDIITKNSDTNYLSYRKGETKWPTGNMKNITLPNGKAAMVPDSVAIIYETNISSQSGTDISNSQ